MSQNAITAPVAPAIDQRSRSEFVGFILLAAFVIAAPLFIYPVLMMKILCFALFACAFNLLILLLYPTLDRAAVQQVRAAGGR